MEKKPLTSPEEIEEICAILEIDVAKVTNFIHYGSRVHGSAAEDSDYDVVIVGDVPDGELQFRKDGYFYEFKMRHVTLINPESGKQFHPQMVYYLKKTC
jgi:predicted nucleotidyltransferase